MTINNVITRCFLFLPVFLDLFEGMIIIIISLYYLSPTTRPIADRIYSKLDTILFEPATLRFLSSIPFVGWEGVVK
jgi:hypothetical protein